MTNEFNQQFRVNEDLVARFAGYRPMRDPIPEEEEQEDGTIDGDQGLSNGIKQGPG